MNIYDVLNELIRQETSKIIPYTGDDRTKSKRVANFMDMRRLSKRDAYVRIMQILRGNDAEFQCEGVADETLDIFNLDTGDSNTGEHKREADSL